MHKLIDESPPEEPLGIYNMGNTCYANAIFQCLMNLPQIRGLLRFCDPEDPIDANIPAGMFAAFMLLHYQQQIKKEKVERTGHKMQLFSQLQKKIGHNYGEQQDPNEFLITLLHLLHNTSPYHYPVNFEIPPETHILERQSVTQLLSEAGSLGDEIKRSDAPKGYTSTVFKDVTGQFHIATCCSECGFTSHRFEVFHSWELPIHGSTLSECLRAFTLPTQLDKDNMYKCDQCKKQNQSVRRFRLWRWPSVLVLTLKRPYMRSDGVMLRDNRSVSLPTELDLEEFCSSRRYMKPRYKLSAILSHVGDSDFGHCYCYVKTSNWYIINDHVVTKQMPPLDSSDHYMLFYELL
jgi:ubiquitin carboxyl-terminal hydrolase 36/42